MDLYEYQGKEIFACAGLRVPDSRLARTVEDADRLAPELGFPLVAKAQALSGGRGKAGGVQVVRDAAELHDAAQRILAMTIKGRPVTALLLEAAVDIQRELYLAVTLDRLAKRPLVMVSTRGGMDIEAVARDEPDALLRVHVDPLLGLREFQIRGLALQAGFSGEQAGAFADVVRCAWAIYCDSDATLVELNPLCLDAGGRFVALDAKVTIDGNAVDRHPELDPLQGVDDPRERQAKLAGLDYVLLDGDIGVLGNGAGLVMSLVDLIAGAGGRAADFLDLHGGVKPERIAAALDILTSDERVSVLLMTVFAAITRCEEVAGALLTAIDQTGTKLPIVVRLTGTHAEQGRALLAAAARPNVHTAASITEAVRTAVALARGAAAAQADKDACAAPRGAAFSGPLHAAAGQD